MAETVKLFETERAKAGGWASTERGWAIVNGMMALMVTMVPAQQREQ
jgi:hypothetical protein